MERLLNALKFRVPSSPHGSGEGLAVTAPKAGRQASRLGYWRFAYYVT